RQTYSGRAVSPRPLPPRLQGSRRQKASGSGAFRVYVAGVFKLWSTDTERPFRAYTRLHRMRPHSGPRRACGQDYPLARAAPSGDSQGDAREEELRTRGVLAIWRGLKPWLSAVKA